MSYVPVMGLDLSLKSTGIVVYSGNKNVVGESVGYDLNRYSNEREKISRWLNIAAKICSICAKNSIKYIAIENSVFGNNIRAIEMSALMAVIKSQLLLKFDIVPVLITATQARKYVLGFVPTGTSQQIKDCVVKEMSELGYVLNTEDEYDALVIAKVLSDGINIRVESLDKEKRKILDDINTKLSGGTIVKKRKKKKNGEKI